MFHLLVQSSLVGAAFIVGMFVMCLLLAGSLRALRTKELFQAKTAHEESLAALKERNAQWRPSPLDYFAAHIAPMLVSYKPSAFDYNNAPLPDNEASAARAYAFARAMLDESVKHRNYLPNVPTDLC